MPPLQRSDSACAVTDAPAASTARQTMERSFIDGLLRCAGCHHAPPAKPPRPARPAGRATGASGSTTRSSPADSALRLVAHRFDVVPVGPDDERRVVVGVIVRAQARRAVVLAAGGECRAVEVVDLLAIRRAEREVQRRRLAGGLVQPEEWLAHGT